jgi:hypothetical protein
MSDANRRVTRAWQLLCLAIAVHVADEALTGFLSVYNPTVEAVRARLPWFPMPVFTFEVWLTGLILAVLLLLSLSPLISRGAGWTRVVACLVGFLMVLNALGHTAGTIFGRTVASVQFPRPMPGFYSSPLLLAASIHLLIRLRSSRTAVG